jgi:hypothetical protein
MKTTLIKKQQGRPKKPKRETVKSLYLRVRLTPAELTRINEISKKSFEKNQSETIRNLIFSRPISVKLIKPEFDDILRTLRRIDTHCGNISRYQRKNMEDIKLEINELREEVIKLNEKIRPMGGIGQLQVFELENSEK